MNNDESELAPILFVVVDDDANVGVCSNVDYATEIFRFSPFWFLINRAVDRPFMKHVADRYNMRHSRPVACG